MKSEDILFSLTVSIVLIVIIKFFFLSPIIVKGESMSSTFNDGDISFSLPSNTYRIFKIFLKDKNYSFLKDKNVIVEHGNKKLIKRCVGIPNDTIILKEISGNEKKIIVPQDSFFLIGDNFRDSYDSRYFGFVGFKEIKGIIVFEKKL
uniref:Peptidase S26 domain-containing protein n=1 Tax=candidate division WOR-3 bacterium TaxID=2052148 RepID=A0A7C3J6S2_UNCW3